MFIGEFLMHGGPRSQRYEDTLQDLIASLQEEGFFSDTIEDYEDLIEEKELEEETHEEST
jgi:DNA-directed RNA polymerase specialized sigma54-like protein